MNVEHIPMSGSGHQNHKVRNCVVVNLKEPMSVVKETPDTQNKNKKEGNPLNQTNQTKDPLDYRGAAGRPAGSLERLFLNMPPEFKGKTSEQTSNLQISAVERIQNCWRFWTAPRIRAWKYDPRKPFRQNQPPGTTRLPGYEISTREAAALHYLAEHGRIGELNRSLIQLRDRGARLTERSLLPICCLCRHLGDPYSTRAVLDFAEKHDTPRSGRLYGQAILTMIDSAPLEDAEAVAWRAVRGGYLPTRESLLKLEEIGSQSVKHWEAHWQLQLLRETEGEKPLESAPYLVYSRHRGHSYEVLSKKDRVSPFHRLASPEPGACFDPLDPVGCADYLEEALEAETVRQRDSTLKMALLKATRKHPLGQSSAQWKALALPYRLGECAPPKEGLSKLLHQAPPLLAEGPPFQAFAWLAELWPGDSHFHDHSEQYEWVPLDYAVWALGEADPLQLWRYLLVQTTQQVGVTRSSQPQSSIGPIGLPRVLIACEESLVVNSRVHATGHASVTSVDLLPPEYEGPRHMTGEVTDILHLGWDLLVGFPPCQHLSNSSALYLPRPGRRARMQSAAAFFRKLWDADIPAIALENPKMHPEAREALGGLRPTQIIHPHLHACEVSKPTGIYLSGLPPLQPSQIVPGRIHSLTILAAGPLRAMIKGRTFDGIARAMAQQWIPEIAAKRLQHETARVHLAIQHRLETLYGKEGALTGPRTDWSAVRYFQKEAKVIAAVWELVDRTPAGPTADPRRRLMVAASREISSANPVPRTVFYAWKRQAELNRGCIFGVATRIGDHTTPKWAGSGGLTKWLDAQRILRDHALGNSPMPSAALITPVLQNPVPPIRRIQHRYGAWRVWTPTVGTDSSPARHEWKKLSPDCQKILDEAVTSLRPAAAVLRKPTPSLVPRETWLRLGRALKRKAPGPGQLPGTRENITSLLPSVARTLDDLCLRCNQPRCGHNPCSRGLGASSCEPPRTSDGSIHFVPATPPVERRICATITKSTAKEIISRQARSWRIRKHRKKSFLGGAPALDKRICTAKGVGLASLRGDLLGGQRYRPYRLRINERTEPQLVTLHVPGAFGEESVSNTPTLQPPHRTHCAWLKDVLISTHNTEQKKRNAPYLVGQACVWSPAAMGDTGAAVSLIGTELLKSLPPDAVAKFRWYRGRVSSNVCGPNGEPLAILGEVNLLLTISRIPFRHTFQVVLGGDLLLLGADFIAPREGDVCPRIDHGDGVAGFCTLSHPHYGRVRLPLTTDPALSSKAPARVAAAHLQKREAAAMPQHHLLFNVTAFRVAPRSERELLLRLPDRLQDPPCQEPLLVKPLAEHRGLDPNVRVAFSLSRPRKPEGSNDLHVPVRVLNLSHSAVSIPALSPLAEMEIGSEEADINDTPHYTREELQRIKEQLVVDPDGVLSEDQRQQVDQLIERRLGAFAQDPNAPSQTHAIEVHLPLKEGAVPHRHAPPRLGVEGRRFVRENVAEMERRGIVYKTQSPWGSRIV